MIFLSDSEGITNKMTDDNKDGSSLQLKGKSLHDASIFTRMWIRTIKNTLERRNKIRDPMARNMMLLDQMCQGMDFITSLADTLPKEVGFDRDLCGEIKDVSEKMKHSVDSLFNWIQSPTYTNEHPVGQEMMRQGQEKLDSFKPRGLDE